VRILKAAHPLGFCISRLLLPMGVTGIAGYAVDDVNPAERLTRHPSSGGLLLIQKKNVCATNGLIRGDPRADDTSAGNYNTRPMPHQEQPRKK
jgi:hypothetical protein